MLTQLLVVRSYTTLQIAQYSEKVSQHKLKTILRHLEKLLKTHSYHMCAVLLATPTTKKKINRTNRFKNAPNFIATRPLVGFLPSLV